MTKEMPSDAQDSPVQRMPTIMLRILGLLLGLLVIPVGFAVVGGNPMWLIQAVEILIIFGLVFFGLLATFQMAFLAYIPEAFAACVVSRPPNPTFYKISIYGGRFALGGSFLTAALGILNAMSNLEDPEMVGKKVAASLSGIVIGFVLWFLFVFLRHAFSTKE